MKHIATISALCLLLMPIPTKAQNTNHPNEPLTGIWQCVAHGGNNGDIPFTLHIQESRESITGWVTAEQGSADISTASRKGNHLQIAIDTDENQYMLTATLKDSQLSGTWQQNGQEKGKWQGKKTSSPEGQE